MCERRNKRKEEGFEMEREEGNNGFYVSLAFFFCGESPLLQNVLSLCAASEHIVFVSIISCCGIGDVACMACLCGLLSAIGHSHNTDVSVWAAVGYRPLLKC